MSTRASNHGPDPRPVLIACVHGTRSADGQAVMAGWQSELADAEPGLTVVPAHLDVQEPTLDDVAAQVARSGRDCVIVPMLLSTGYHVRVDIARAVDAVSELGGFGVAAAALGPDPLLVELLRQRLDEVGAGPEDAIVLAAAGSSDPRAVADVEASAVMLARERGTPVRPAYLTAARPTVAEAIEQLRAEEPHRAVTVANYLLAPGHFATVLAGVDADRVAACLAPSPALTRLVLRRYDQAAATRSAQPSHRPQVPHS